MEQQSTPENQSTTSQLQPHGFSSTTGILVTTALIVALGVGGYFLWTGGFFSGVVMPEEAAEEIIPEVSDIEMELGTIELGTDAELEALEAGL